MLWRRRTKASEVCLLSGLLVVFQLSQTEASPLTEYSEQDQQKVEPNALSGYRRGTIEFGKGLKNSSVEEDSDYQADSGGSQEHLHRIFGQMMSSVWCGQHDLRFNAFGPNSRKFVLSQNPALPWSQVPTSCGYSVQENPLRLVLDVPYDGCYIMIQDGCYNLPLSWHGIPVTLKCPKPEDLSTTVAPTQHPILDLFPFLTPPQEPTAAPTQEPMPQISPELLNALMYWLFVTQTQPTTSPQEQWYRELMLYYIWQLILSQHMTVPQNPVTQAPSSDWHLHFLQGLKIPYPGQTTTPTPQNPIPQLNLNNLQTLFQQSPINYPPQLPSTGQTQNQHYPVPNVGQMQSQQQLMWPLKFPL